MTDTITVVRNAAWAIVFDEAEGRHVYRTGDDIVFSRRGVLHIAGRYDGAADREIDGSRLLVMPGLVNIHCHSGDEPIAKGLFEDVGTAALWGNALYEYSALIDSDDDAKAACQTVMLAELMRSGVTTVLDIAGPHSRWLELMAASGLRAYAAPGFRQAQWRVIDSHRLDFDWDEGRGRERFAEALATVDAARAHPCGRIDGVVTPSQIETVREDLLADAAAEARKRGMRITIHAAQTMAEHEEMLRRSGLTAPAYLDRIGVLGDDVILGHSIFLDHHSWTRQRTRADLALLAARGASVAHCPVTFARSGMTLETLGGYQRVGVNVGLGTDSYPFNMLEEMRQALICARIAGRQVFEVDTAGVFGAATLGGAKALGRSDIGRLGVGAKADLALIEIDHPLMQPVYDPLRSLIHCAAERAVRDVFVDGRQTLDNRRPVGLDYDGAIALLAHAQAHACRRAVQQDPQRRTMRQLAPLALPCAD